MSEPLSFDKYKTITDNNKKIAKKYITDIENKLKKDLEVEKETIESDENKNNFIFLIDNFNSINSYLKKGFATPKELQLITNKLNFILNEEDYSLSRIYIVLCFYNAYRIYKDKFLELPSSYVELITSLHISFEESYDIRKLDHISDFVFNKNIMEELENITLDNRELLNRCESIVDEYLNGDITAPVDYWAKKEIEFLKESKEINDKHGPGFFGYGIRTAEFIQKRLDEQLENMSFVFAPDKYFSIKSDIEMIVYKIRNMSEKNRKSFYKFIEKIDASSEINPIEKLERTLDMAETLYNFSMNASDDELKRAK